MAKPGQRMKLLLSVLLFGGYLLAMAMDVTGVGLHQWIGISLALLAGYHLSVHHAWVASVSKRLFHGAGGRTRALYALDVALLVGFVGITVTGLVLSTWLNLPLASYEAWRVAHVALSIATLWLVVVKVGMHWRWIAGSVRRQLVRPTTAVQPATTSARTAPSVSRRQFMTTMGSAGALAAIASTWVLRGEVVAQTATPEQPAFAATAGDTTLDVPVAVPAVGDDEASQALTPAATASDPPAGAPARPAATEPAATATATAVAASGGSTSCTVQCRRACSYPGGCRKYVDSNGNGRCDFGECM